MWLGPLKAMLGLFEGGHEPTSDAQDHTFEEFGLTVAVARHLRAACSAAIDLLADSPANCGKTSEVVLRDP